MNQIISIFFSYGVVLNLLNLLPNFISNQLFYFKNLVLFSNFYYLVIQDQLMEFQNFNQSQLYSLRSLKIIFFFMAVQVVQVLVLLPINVFLWLHIFQMFQFNRLKQHVLIIMKDQFLTKDIFLKNRLNDYLNIYLFIIAVTMLMQPFIKGIFFFFYLNILQLELISIFAFEFNFYFFSLYSLVSRNHVSNFI